MQKIHLFYDSQRDIHIFHNLMRHSENKHNALQYHFIKYNAEEGYIKVHFVQTKDQLVDIFTKALDEK